MRSITLLILLLLPYSYLFAQAQAGIEQYHYIGSTSSSAIVPVVHMQSKKGWYGEARYNYDEQNTFSLLGGRTFSHDGKLPFSITPMIGFSMGDLHGWTAGTNVSIEKSSFFFNTQSQYTISTTKGYSNFVFNWCELGYQPLDWLYGGVSLQHTQLKGEAALFEPGAMIGLSFKRISFPIYVFNTFNENRFVILGVNWEWQR